MKTRDDDNLTAPLPAPRRRPRKRRRSPSLSEDQTDDPRRPEKRNRADEPADDSAAVVVVDEPPLLLAQNNGDVKNDSRSEQYHYDFCRFTSTELEAGRLPSAAAGYPIPEIEGDDVVTF